jgi:hypothetical protein
MPRNVSIKTLKKRRPASRPLGQILRTTDNHFIDFIRRCFEFVIYINIKIKMFYI